MSEHNNDMNNEAVDNNMSICNSNNTSHNSTVYNETSTPPNYVFSRDKKVDSSDFNAFRDEIRTLISSMFTAQDIELKKISQPLQDIQQSNQKIEASVSTLIAQNEDFKKKIHQLELQAQEDKNKIILMEEKIEFLEMNNRKSSFVIKNVPYAPNETKEYLIDLVLCLASTIGITISKSNLSDIYRVKAKSGASLNSPVVVETTSVLIKTEILRSCKSFNIKNKTKLCAKHLGMRKNEDCPVYVAEHLTTKGSRLMFLARDLIKSTSYKFCWTSYGKIYVRKDENSPVILIKTEAQIQGLFNKE